jgi:hypothetical protein
MASSAAKELVAYAMALTPAALVETSSSSQKSPSPDCKPAD